MKGKLIDNKTMLELDFNSLCEYLKKKLEKKDVIYINFSKIKETYPGYYFTRTNYYYTTRPMHYFIPFPKTAMSFSNNVIKHLRECGYKNIKYIDCAKNRKKVVSIMYRISKSEV